MASSEGISDDTFRQLLSIVSRWYDKRKYISRLKVLYTDHVENACDLDEATKTIDLLDLLISSGDLSPTDLTILYDTMNATKQFGLEKEIKKLIPSCPNVKNIVISKFTPHRQKLLKLGMSLRQVDVAKISELYNNPVMRYEDSCSLIMDLEHRRIICEGKMEIFIQKLHTFELSLAVESLTKVIGLKRNRKHKRQDAESGDEPCNVTNLQVGLIFNNRKRKSQDAEYEDEPRKNDPLMSIKDTVTNFGYLRAKDMNEFVKEHKCISNYLYEIGLTIDGVSDGSMVFHLSVSDHNALENLWEITLSGELIHDLAKVLVPADLQEEFIERWSTELDEKEYQAALNKLRERVRCDSYDFCIISEDAEWENKLIKDLKQKKPNLKCIIMKNWRLSKPSKTINHSIWQSIKIIIGFSPKPLTDYSKYAAHSVIFEMMEAKTLDDAKLIPVRISEDAVVPPEFESFTVDNAWEEEFVGKLLQVLCVIGLKRNRKPKRQDAESGDEPCNVTNLQETEMSAKKKISNNAVPMTGIESVPVRFPNETPKRMKSADILRRPQQITADKRNKPTCDEFVLDPNPVGIDLKMCNLFRHPDINHRDFLFLHVHVDFPYKDLFEFLSKGLLVSYRKGKVKQCRYIFFGQSPSQLRNRTCILYDEKLGCLNDIIQRFGDFSSINNVAKRAARIGLLLSTANEVIQLGDADITKEEDIERDGYNFTDGCGRISVECATRITEEMGLTELYKHQVPPVPSVFQIRLKGCKGVLVVDPKLPKGIKIRNSLEKFSWKLTEPHILGVVDDGISKPYAYGNLIKHFIRILSALGVPDKVFLKLQTSFFEELHNLEKDKWIAIKHLYIIGRSDLAEKVISMQDDYCSNREIREVLQSIRRKVFDDRKVGASEKQERNKKSKAEGLNIRAELSRNVFGVCDISETLEEGSVFFQPTIRGKSVVVKGRVIVAKSPSYYPGDIRILTCVDNKHCRHLVDCVVFPVKGKRPHCDEIAGSDLDGDKYFICWDPDLVPKQHWKPTSYQGAKSKTQGNITITDLIRYFSYYDVRLVGKFSNLLEKWADIAGIDSPECMALANLFNHAIDTAKTGENVTVPTCLKTTRQKGEKVFVCQKMVNNAKSLIGDTKDSISKIEQEMREEYGDTSEEYKTFQDAASLVYKASGTTRCDGDNPNLILRRRSGIVRLLMLRHNLEIREETTVLSNELMDASEETISSLLRSNNWPADDFKLFRMMYKWCQRHQKIDLLSEFCKLIDFSTFTRLQRELAMVDCPDSTERIRGRHSGLESSSILSENDVANLSSEISPTKWSLMYTVLNQDEEIFSWEDILSKMTDDLPKLLVCKFDLGGSWVITIFVPGALELLQTSNDTTTLPDLRAFVSVHGFNPENCIVNKSKVVHAVLLRRSRLQIYPADQSTRNTFICMMEEDGRTKMSVALQNFSSGFKSRYPDRYLRREPILSCEIFLGASDTRKLPTYYVTDTDPPDFNPEIELPECPEFLYRQEDFPIVSSSPEAHTEHTRTWFDEVDNTFDELKMLAENGTLLDSQLQGLFAMANGDSENGAYVASYVETLFSKTNTRLSDDYTDTLYYKLLCFLAMSRNSAVEKISRYLESMERKGIYFRVDTYVNFLKLLVYGNAVDAYSVELLKQFEIGLFPLDPSDFKTEGAKVYFLRWTSLLTIETMEEAKTFKKMATDTKNIMRADAFPEGKMARWLNIQAERQMFSPQDGIALSPSHREDNDPLFQPKYFAECVQSRRTGLVIQVNLICKVSSDRQEELTKDDVPNRSHWRVDRFINLVSYRRMLAALKNICALPSDTVNETCPIASVISPEFQYSHSNSDVETEESAQSVRENATPVSDAHSGPSTTSARPNAAREGVQSVSHGKRPGVNLPSSKSEKRSGNESQIEAIDAAMHDGITIIQGPPGTGKTFTAAEIIRRWLDDWDSRPILACAETNEGVNNLIMKVLKLSGLSADDMVRIGNVSKVTDDMKRITIEAKYFAKGHKAHDMQIDFAIAKDIIHRAKIVFSTCIGAGVSYMTDQYFPHVLLDEASQATEPAALVPLQYGCRRLCLVGDDKQLPPLVKSSNADNLEVSIFERLRKTFPTHLLNIQYRMHPTLAAFPSLKFYDNRVLDGVGAKDRPLPRGFPYHEKEKPLLFLDIRSRETSDGDSKLNRDEAHEIKTLVGSLLEAKDVNESDIGIISPYKAQVRLIKELLKKPKIDVRTVDGFQGQEREVIIFSTVRSNDDKFIGFLDNERRFNVSITRARRGLIVVGNSTTLRSSALWSEWIDWTIRNKSMVEVNPSEHTDKGARKEGTSQDAVRNGSGARPKDGRRAGMGRGGRGRGGSTRGGSSKGGRGMIQNWDRW